MEYEKDGNFEQAIETYTTAIICWYEIKYKLWSITREITERLQRRTSTDGFLLFFQCSPYYHQLYIDRAYAYMEIKDYRYRVIILFNAHLDYIILPHRTELLRWMACVQCN